LKIEITPTKNYQKNERFAQNSMNWVLSHRKGSSNNSSGLTMGAKGMAAFSHNSKMSKALSINIFLSLSRYFDATEFLQLIDVGEPL
jgi:hypothetical protein